MNRPSQEKWITWTLSILSLILLIYTVLRAATLSMTHDESSTYLNSISQPLWECFFSDVCWHSANIHLLNSWLMQISVKIFGATEFFVRLPNVLAHAVYLFFSIRLLLAVDSRFWVALGGFMLLNLNPYFLEFFALGRGYGLASAWVMMGSFYLFRFLEKKNLGSLIGVMVACVLAVLSNFTFLNYFAATGAFLGTIALLDLLKLNRFFPLWSDRPFGSVKPWLIIGLVGATTLVMGAILYMPITSLKKLGEFEYGVGLLKDTLHIMVEDFLMREGYFSGATQRVFVWLAVLFGFGAAFWGMLQAFRKTNAPVSRFYFGVSFALLMFIFGLKVQFYLLGTQYLSHRTALIFVPMTCLPIWLMFSQFAQEKGWRKISGQVLSGVMALFFVLHFTRTANLTHSREWYYDMETRGLVDYISAHEKPGEKINLGVHWLFSHSTAFYRETRHLDFLEPILYNKDLRSDTLFDYYYVLPDQGPQLNPAYEEVKQFGWQAKLFKRKGYKPGCD